MTLFQRLARIATAAVVRQPRLWPVFRRTVQRQFDRLAPQWDSIRSPGHLAAFEAALEAVPAAPKCVLDVGTGTGDAAFSMARRWPAAEVVGVDLAEGMVAEARRKLPPELGSRVRIERADAAALPFPAGSFDLVALANMIPFFDELARVVAPGGHVLFSYSLGAATPIYVPPARLGRELAQRGFSAPAAFAVGRSAAFLATKTRGD